MTNLKLTLQALCITVALSINLVSAANSNEFKDGPVIFGFGKHAPVDVDMPLNTQQPIKVAFDVAKQGKNDSYNANINSVARFLNMNVAAGFKPQNLNLALVIHGGAGFDIMHNKAYKTKYGVDNPNAKLIRQLLANNVKIYLCGQSAAYMGIEKQQLYPGIKMALSAMSAHAMLHQQGYHANPF